LTKLASGDCPPIEMSILSGSRPASADIWRSLRTSSISGVDLLTGVVFERNLDAELAFRTGALHDPTRGWQDYRELQAMLR
jgi:hypothetical protein